MNRDIADRPTAVVDPILARRATAAASSSARQHRSVAVRVWTRKAIFAVGAGDEEPAPPRFGGEAAGPRLVAGSGRPRALGGDRSRRVRRGRRASGCRGGGRDRRDTVPADAAPAASRHRSARRTRGVFVTVNRDCSPRDEQQGRASGVAGRRQSPGGGGGGRPIHRDEREPVQRRREAENAKG